jgi:hypothetical protein
MPDQVETPTVDAGGDLISPERGNMLLDLIGRPEGYWCMNSLQAFLVAPLFCGLKVAVDQKMYEHTVAFESESGEVLGRIVHLAVPHVTAI